MRGTDLPQIAHAALQRRRKLEPLGEPQSDQGGAERGRAHHLELVQGRRERSEPEEAGGLPAADSLRA